LRRGNRGLLLRQARRTAHKEQHSDRSDKSQFGPHFDERILADFTRFFSAASVADLRELCVNLFLRLYRPSSVDRLALFVAH